MMRRPFATALAVAAMALVLIACEDTNTNWGPKVSYYDGILRVSGEGYFYNDANARAANQMTVHDRAADGNNVYGYTTFKTWKYSSITGSTDWQLIQAKSTSEVSNASINQTLKVNLDPNGSRARGETMVCAQMGWPVPDSCSSPSFPTFDY